MNDSEYGTFKDSGKNPAEIAAAKKKEAAEKKAAEKASKTA
jgi:hypothetical protein